MPPVATANAKTKTNKATAKKPTKAVEKAAKPILYPDIEALICMEGDAITADKMKEILGWVEEPEQPKGEGAEKLPPEVLFGNDYMLTDRYGKKVRCNNNTINRPFDSGLAETYAQEFLNKRWQLNGESFIIGKYGQVESGQHRGIGLVLAEQDRQLDAIKEEKGEAYVGWSKNWPTPVVYETVLVRGIDESDKVVNTIDTGRIRSLAHIVYRSDVFHNMPSKKKLEASKMLEAAIRVLWDRSGASDDPYAPRRTNSEALDFLEHHQHILRAVKHIQEENAANRAIHKWCPVGQASALLYLMATSSEATDAEKYRKGEPRNEKKVSFDNWEQACDFWVNLAGGNPELRAVREKVGLLQDPVSGGGLGGNVEERVAVIVKAWNLFKDGLPITQDDLSLDYYYDKEELINAVQMPRISGGIDIGTVKQRNAEKKILKEQQKEEEAERKADEQALEAAKIKDENLDKMKDENKKPKGKAKKKDVVEEPTEDEGPTTDELNEEGEVSGEDE